MPEPSEQQFPEQDFLGDSHESTSGSPATAGPTGNRPAGGAPVMRPDEMASDEWGGDDNARDFLGLDGQPNHRPDDGSAAEYLSETSRETGSALADAPELEAGEFENWLEDDSEDSASWLMELDEQPSEDAFDPERLESEFGIQSSATASSRGGWILRVTLVAAGLGAGFVGARWYGDQQLKSSGDTNIAHVRTTTDSTANGTAAPDGGTGREVANGNANGNAKDAMTKNTTPENAAPKGNKNNQRNGQRPQNTGTNTEPGATAVATAPSGTTSGATNATTEPKVDTAPTVENSGTELIPDPFFPAIDGPGATDSGSEAVTLPETTPRTGNGKTFTMPVEDMVVIPRVESPVRYASEDDLAAVWGKREIPLTEIGSEDRMLTPQVGRVRIVIHGGEVFEGRLYAVGQNKVWLDTGLGKMALLGWQVDRIEHLADKVAATLGEKGSEDLTGLPRVRVRTPGGVFYGKLLDQDQGDVTLITEDGGRIRLANARVEPAGKSRTRIVDPGGAKAQEAASKPE